MERELKEYERGLTDRPTAIDHWILWATGGSDAIAAVLASAGVPAHIRPRLQAIAVRLVRFRTEADKLQTEIIEIVTFRRMRRGADILARLSHIRDEVTALKVDLQKVMTAW